MWHAIQVTLVQRSHAETSTSHLSCGEYAVLPLDCMAILGLRFNGYSILSDLINFISEVYYPDWLANVVIVKKANG